MSRPSRRASQQNVAQPDAAIAEISAAEVQLASAPAATDDTSSQTDVFEVGAGNALAAGDSNQRYYIYSYGEWAGNHTISDLSPGDKVYIWVEEGSSEDYTYVVQGADTLVTIGQSTILLKNFVADNLRDFVAIEENVVIRIDPIEDPIEIISPPPTDSPATVSPSGTVAQPAELDGETTAVPSTDASETGDQVTVGGEEPQRHYIYSYGERAGNHTISDLSPGDKVYIWVEEGSSEDYTYVVQGADTLVTIGQSTILLKNFVADNLRDFVIIEENFIIQLDPAGVEVVDPGSSTAQPGAPSAGDAAPDSPSLVHSAETSVVPQRSLYGNDDGELLDPDASYKGIFGYGGDDTVIAGASDAWLQGDAGNDLVIARSGANTMYGGAGRDTLIGGAEGDNIRGDSGDDLLTGGGGNDKFVFFATDAEAGTDTIDDFTTEDRLFFWIAEGSRDILQFQVLDGDTLVTVGNSSVLLKNFVADDIRDFVTIEQNYTVSVGDDETIVEGPKLFEGTGADELLSPDASYRSVFGWDGNDTIVAGRSDALLAGGDGSDLLIARGGKNALYGWLGNDTLVGGSGDDEIEGGGGSNYLSGGGGNDTFVFDGPSIFPFEDTIADFETGDRLSFLLQGAENDLQIQVQGRDTLITVGKSSVLLENFVAENLSNFIAIEQEMLIRLDPYMRAQFAF